MMEKNPKRNPTLAMQGYSTGKPKAWEIETGRKLGVARGWGASEEVQS